MTFTIPDDIACRLQTLVPSGERSRMIAGFLEGELKRRSEVLIRSCQAANADSETRKAVEEWQGFDEKIEGP